MNRRIILYTTAIMITLTLSFLLLEFGLLGIIEKTKLNGMEGSAISVIGSYQSDSAYSMVEVYGNGVSVFASPFLWNMAYSKGLVNMTISDYLYVNVDLHDFRKVIPSIPVDGYPGLMYGQECWFPFAGKTMERGIIMPVKVIEMPNFNSTVYYTVYQVNGVIDDFSYDMWLTENPCTTYLEFPDIEIMVWLYHEGGPIPTSFIKIGNLTVTINVNGRSIKDVFVVYILPHTGSSNGWIGIYYVSERQLVGGRVVIPLSVFIRDSFTFIDRLYPSISPLNYYLDAIQLGMEFDDDNGTAILGYTLYYWMLGNVTLIGQLH